MLLGEPAEDLIGVLDPSGRWLIAGMVIGAAVLVLAVLIFSGAWQQ